LNTGLKPDPLEITFRSWIHDNLYGALSFLSLRVCHIESLQKPYHDRRYSFVRQVIEGESRLRQKLIVKGSLHFQCLRESDPSKLVSFMHKLTEVTKCLRSQRTVIFVVAVKAVGTFHVIGWTSQHLGICNEHLTGRQRHGTRRVQRWLAIDALVRRK
jgi:hypothetical protein